MDLTEIASDSDDFATKQRDYSEMCPTSTRNTRILQDAAESVSPSLGFHWSRVHLLGTDLALFFVTSVLILVPCFWQTRIQAGDLSSHLYNAWLTLLIKHGQIKGLWIARQWDNILFDVSLEWLFVHFGVRVAERVAVALAVLIFFWGSLSFVRTVTAKLPWFVTPCIAMLAYGYVFQMGFFNFYLSLGLSFFALAVLWRGSSKYALIALPLLALAWTAHPLPVLWCLATAAYNWIARAIPFRGQLILFAISAMLLYLLRCFLVRLPNQWSWRQLALITGADQSVIYENHYVILAIGLVFLWVTLYMRASQKRSHVTFSVPVQLGLLAGVGTFILPDAVLLAGYDAPFNFLMARMSITTAVLACCVSGTASATKFHRYAFGLIALAFFAFLYLDQRSLNKIEDRLSQVVGQLPPGQRVVASLSLPMARVQIPHMVDRACIGHCFSYGNYEPSTGQFRVRATPHNVVVVSSDSDSKALQAGRYRVRAGNLPLYQIYSCGRQNTDLCVRSLAAGEINGGPTAPGN